MPGPSPNVATASSRSAWPSGVSRLPNGAQMEMNRSAGSMPSTGFSGSGRQATQIQREPTGGFDPTPQLAPLPKSPARRAIGVAPGPANHVSTPTWTPSPSSATTWPDRMTLPWAA